MELLIDSGNSRLKWACILEGEFRSHPPQPGGRPLSGLDLDRIWGGLKPLPRQVWIANVAGDEVARMLTDWIESRWQLSPQFVVSQPEGYGVTNAYSDPSRLGVDRWLALIGARHHHPLPACIVDCGTALTVDVLDSEGCHRGGVICPGLRLMSQSLGTETAGIGLLELDLFTTGILADNTVNAVGFGIRHAVIGVIEQVTRLLAHELPGLHLILTGGDATEIASFFSGKSKIVPDLVLQGLAVVSRCQ